MKKLKIVIDLDTCIRTGQCYYMHPKLIGARDDAYPQAINPLSVAGTDMQEAETLLDVCPVGAISLVDAE